MNKMLGEPSSKSAEPVTSGFVFTPEELDAESRWNQRLFEAKMALRPHHSANRYTRLHPRLFQVIKTSLRGAERK